MMHCSSRGGEIERLGGVIDRVVASLMARRKAAADSVCLELEEKLAEALAEPPGLRSPAPAPASAFGGEPMAAVL